ncbi:MAG: ornithine decarboxylase, partial [Chloroflexi bacterium]
LDGGLDDRLGSHGLDTKAEQLAAASMGADTVLFSTNGSSLSMQASIMSVAAPGEEILVARNLHKSTFNGLILGGARPVFVRPAVDAELEMLHGVTPEALSHAFDTHPGARAAVIVSPTYYGVVADVARLAEVCHRRGVPLITDDAWGAHFLVHPELPDSALSAGSDIAVASLHKTGSGLMQGSIIAVRGDRIDVTRLKHTLGLLESTSTSMLILAAMDGARRHLALHGHGLLKRTIALSRRARACLARIPGVGVMGREIVGRSGVFDLDETKVVVDVQALNLSGFAAADWLIHECEMPMELADHRRVVALLTLADDDRSVDRLIAGFEAMAAAAATMPARGTMAIPAVESLFTDALLTPRDAFFAPRSVTALDDAEGRIAGESVTPYPPGIPAVVPGERWTRSIIRYLRTGLEHGMHIAEAADPKLGTVLVVEPPVQCRRVPM